MQKSNLVEFNPEDVKSVYLFGLSISSSVRFQELGLKLCENKKEVRKPELNGYVHATGSAGLSIGQVGLQSRGPQP